MDESEIRIQSDLMCQMFLMQLERLPKLLPLSDISKLIILV